MEETIRKSKMLQFLRADIYHRPFVCKKCKGIMIYRGVGEYQCEECGEYDYDDYGKVRNYVEANPGVSAEETALATGVSKKSIRSMLKESKLVLLPNSISFLRCEICNCTIRHGRLCAACEVAYRQAVEDEFRAAQGNHTIEGGFATPSVNEGEMRFTREE